MDPVSIAVATIGTADVTIRLIGFVRKTVEGTKTIDQTLNDVLRLVGRLQSVTSGIRTITCAPDFEQQWRSSFEGAASLTKPWEQLWVDTLGFLEEANQVLQTLDDMLKNIQGSKKRGVDQGSKEEFEAESQPLLV